MNFKFSAGRQYTDYALNYINDIYPGNYSIETKLFRYLYKYPGETKDAYYRRQINSVFHNYLRAIIMNVAEKPFANEITYINDFPEQLNQYKKHFDFVGDSVLQAAYKTMISGLRDGLCLLVSDMDENGKCFQRKVQAQDIIGCWTGVNSEGNAFISRVQFIVRNYKEPEISNNPANDSDTEAMSETISCQIYDMIHPNRVDIYEAEKRDGEDFFQNQLNGYGFGTNQGFGLNNNIGIFESQNNQSNITNRRYGVVKDIQGKYIKTTFLKGFDKLPAYLFITGDRLNENNVLQVVPLFYDLARMNIQHFNKKSDQDYIISISRFAILAATGVNADSLKKNLQNAEDDKISIGPNMLLIDKNPSAKYQFVEHSGKAIQSGVDDILMLEKTMTSLLTRYLERVNYETATASNIEDKQKKLYALYLSNVLENIYSETLKDFARYKGIKIKDEEVKLLSFSTDYNISEIKTKVDTLMNARKMGEITSETFLKELENNNIFSNSFEVEKELENLEKENMDMINENDNENNKENEEEVNQNEREKEKTNEAKKVLNTKMVKK